MQEAEEAQRVPARRYLFHNCPVCDSLARFPEESQVPKFFNKINDYLTSLEEQVKPEEQK